MEQIQTVITESRYTGPAVRRADGTSALLLAYPPSGGIGIHSYLVLRKDQSGADFMGGYPFFEGLPMTAILEQFHMWSNGLSGSVALSSLDGHCRLACFLAGFFLHAPEMIPGRQVEARVAAFACSLTREEHTEVVPAQGSPAWNLALRRFLKSHPGARAKDFQAPVFSSHGKAIILPLSVVGMYAFQLPVLGVEKVRFLNQDYLRIRTLFSGSEGRGQTGILYVSTHVLKGYIPEIGDDVTGMMWMQCSLGCFPISDSEGCSA